MIADHLNWCLCFMSAWIVGKVLAPAKANIIVEKALITPIVDGGGYSIAVGAWYPSSVVYPVVIFLWSIKAWIMTQTQATTVVKRAPTAIGLKMKDESYFSIQIPFWVKLFYKVAWADHCTEVRFSSLLSGGFITAIVVNPPESKLAKCTSVQWETLNF